MRWTAEALWVVFTTAGVDPRTMRPYPVERPAAVSPWQVEKAKNRLQRAVEQAETRRKVPRAFQEKQVQRALSHAKMLIRYR